MFILGQTKFLKINKYVHSKMRTKLNKSFIKVKLMIVTTWNPVPFALNDP